MDHIFVELVEKHREEVSIWILCFMVSQGKNTHLGKFMKRWFGPTNLQYCLPNNIVFFVFINNFEPKPVLVIVNKLKPYKYVDQTLNAIQISKN
jgi:hypothetical protein